MRMLQKILIFQQPPWAFYNTIISTIQQNYFQIYI